MTRESSHPGMQRNKKYHSGDFVEEKMLRLGHIAVELTKENEEQRVRAVPSTSLEKLVERIGTLEYVITQIEDLEKYFQSIIEETTQYLMSVVQDEQLQ